MKHLIIVLTILFVIFGLSNIFGVKFFVVSGSSMEPSISLGSFVVVVPKEKYLVGDVLSYKFKNAKTNIVTHRIVEIKEVGNKFLYYTKGDSNKYSDQVPVSSTEIIGKVLFVLPGLGKFLSEYTWLLVLYASTGFVVGKEVRKIFDFKKFA